MEISEVVSKFSVEGNFVSAEPYGSGHINVTSRVVTEASGRLYEYILQKINHNVFKNPGELMENYVGVTEYLRKMIEAAGGDPLRETVNVVKTKEGENFYYSEEGEYWRMLIFVSNSMSYDKVEKPEQFYDSAVAFGNFQYLLRDYPAPTLHETIVNFHNTPDRIRLFEEALKADVCGRAKDVQEEIDFVLSRREFAATLENARKNGKLPLRVTHNDTKLNNILFDDKTQKPVCVIDLDTVMPGYSVNDFGDAIRFGANTAAEDETDLSKVSLDLTLYRAFAKGFLKGCHGKLTDSEIALLPIGARMMTFECGMRFLTDYIEGDHYFRTSREGHNLDRCRCQFALVADMEKKAEQMKLI